MTFAAAVIIAESRVLNASIDVMSTVDLRGHRHRSLQPLCRTKHDASILWEVATSTAMHTKASYRNPDEPPVADEMRAVSPLIHPNSRSPHKSGCHSTRRVAHHRIRLTLECCQSDNCSLRQVPAIQATSPIPVSSVQSIPPASTQPPHASSLLDVSRH